MSSDRGKPCSIVSTGGRRRASGAGCFTRFKPIATTNGTVSTARSTALTSTPREEKGGAAEQGIGRSRGGLSTKVHVVVDALGLPLTFEITEGQRHDNRPAKELVARVLSTCLLADKAYDSDAFRAALAEQNCVPVIPSNGSRAQKLPYDKERYKARSEIECTFSLLKQARRFATRYEKTLRNYAAVVAIGCALLWLRI